MYISAMNFYKLLPFCALFFLLACGEDSSSTSSAEPEEYSSSTESDESSSSVKKEKSSSSEKVEISSSSEKASSSSKKEDASSSSVTPKSSSSLLSDPLELFDTRKPKKNFYTCHYKDEFGGFDEDFDQQDWICTFKYKDKEGYIYLQTTPTSCTQIWSLLPNMATDSAIMYINGEYVTPDSVTYDWGGNHHNDFFRIDYDGKIFEYSHSTYAAGYRACQEMDCLKVFQSDGKTLIEDGCHAQAEDLAESRTLPIVCRMASLEDGTFGDFTDTFKLCPSDSRLRRQQEQ